MLRTLIEKECKTILLSPRFAGTFAVASVLILVSVVIGLREYRAFEAAQAAAAGLLAEEQAQASSWMGFPNRVFRAPDPLQIFAAGVHNDVGRLSAVGSMQDAKLRQSIYSDDPILAVFRFLDLTFIIQIILSLFAVLLTYDAISGEREQGTLQLTFASPVPRARYLAAKLLGTWAGLTVPLLVPLLIGLLIVVLAGVPMAAGDWGRLATLLLAGGLYFTFFIALGVAVSALTRRSSTSFLVLLSAWILIVLVLPRAGVMAAVDLLPVPSVAEIDSRKEGFERREWDAHRQKIMEKWRQRQAEIEAVPEEEREAFEDERTWAWMEEDEEEQQAVQTRIADYSRRVGEELRALHARQRRLGLALSRISPAASFQMVALEAAGTGLGLPDRYADSIAEYGDRFRRHVESRGGNRFTIRMGHSDDEDEEEGGEAGGTDPFAQGEPLDLRDMPRYEPPGVDARGVIAAAIPDLGLLGLLAVACFAVSFTAFLRYDVRPA